MKTITSVKNERVKAAAKLVMSSKARREQRRFVLEGLRLCMDILRSGLRCAELYVAAEFCEKHADEYEALAKISDEVFLVNDAVLERLSDTRTPQGVCCVVRMPERAALLKQTPGSSQTASLSACPEMSRPASDEIRPVSEETQSALEERPTTSAQKLLLLENIQDPANLGAMSRTAEALGISGLLVIGGCDVYSPKALRASMGALLRLPVEVAGTTAEDSISVLQNAEALGFRTYASTPAADAVPVTTVDFSGPVLCVVGNEANGVTPQTMDTCTARVTIPMEGRAESLNAAAAGAILMWEMVR